MQMRDKEMLTLEISSITHAGALAWNNRFWEIRDLEKS